MAQRTEPSRLRGNGIGGLSVNRTDSHADPTDGGKRSAACEIVVSRLKLPGDQFLTRLHMSFPV